MCLYPIRTKKITEEGMLDIKNICSKKELNTMDTSILEEGKHSSKLACHLGTPLGYKIPSLTTQSWHFSITIEVTQ
jgi:hypothetical protein